MQIRNTAKLLNPDTCMCMLGYAPAKFGKTTLGATLNEMTQKFYGQPTLFIAVEPADGGGTSSIQDYGIDFVQPTTLQQLNAVLTGLQTDTKYKGIVLDNASDMSKSIIAPHALTFPTRGAAPQTRSVGVPCRDDYQVMGELTRRVFQQLINLTKHENPKMRKHLLVNALQKEKTEDSRVTAIVPDLPGASADGATAMFELVYSIAIKNRVVPDPSDPKKTLRKLERVMVTKGDGVKVLGDRYHVFPDEGPVDFCELYEKFWLPRVEASK